MRESTRLPRSILLISRAGSEMGSEQVTSSVFSKVLFQFVLVIMTARPVRSHLEFFLHGWRRYVCREAQVTLIELNRDTKEIRAKQQNKAPQNKHNQKQPTQNKTQKQRAGLVSYRG